MKNDGSHWPLILIAGLFAFAFFSGTNPSDGVRAFHDRDLHESYGWGDR